ncbi:MAG: VWA domain-containing protein [Planctomycetaceae bacterium]|nr:VWA domain-containing protein [Planctomycetaceae bacterium]
MEQHFSFQGLYQTGWFAASLVALVVSGVCIWMLYRYERHLVDKSVGTALVTLRLSVLALILFVVLQPVMSWSLTEKQQGRIAVAIDLSESMQTRDEHASLAEDLRWAYSLGMIGGGSTEDQVKRWIVEAEAGEEPMWVTPGEEPNEQKRIQLADSRRENIEQIRESLHELSRAELAGRLLTSASSPLLEELSKVTSIDLELFAGKAEGVAEELLGESLEKPPYLIDPQSSNLSAALEHASADLESAPLSGVILLTDGRDNSNFDPLNQSIRFSLTGIPIYPVMIGSENKPKDLSIASVEYPQTAFKDDKVVLSATINTSGFDGSEVDVELRADDAEPVVKTIRADGDMTQVDFDLDSSAIGRTEYRLFVPVQNDETRDDNNEKSFAMAVVDDMVHVLLLEGEARWEFRFIDNAFTRDERIDIEKVVYEQPYLGVLEETFFKKELTLPDDVTDLADSPFVDKDIVILGDVGPEYLQPGFFELLDQFVAEAGGTLVITAGKKSMPRAYQNETLSRLLPILDPQPVNVSGSQGIGSPRERGFHLQLTPEGEAEPFLQFDADRVRNREIWKSLPGFEWGLFGEPRPGSTVLATTLPGEEIPALEALDRSAVIVHQYYGFGQVMWIGVDSTWRWRHRAGDKYHHRFWGQLGRWAARNRSSAGNDFVRFGPARTDIPQGEDAVIKARFVQQYLKQYPDLKASTEVYRLDENDVRELFTTIELNVNPARPLSYEGRAVGLPAGRYRLKLLIEGADPQAGDLEAPLYVQEQPTPELSDLSSNRELLVQMANLSDGQFFMPDEMSELLSVVKDPLADRVIREEVELWDRWWLMLLVFALLTVEWVTRKLNGLP